MQGTSRYHLWTGQRSGFYSPARQVAGVRKKNHTIPRPFPNRRILSIACLDDTEWLKVDRSLCCQLIRTLKITCWLAGPLSTHEKMHATTRLLQHACRITLFTRETCGLCTQAKSVLSDVWDRRPFEYKEIDIIKSEQIPRWRDLYEFDVPVVCGMS